MKRTTFAIVLTLTSMSVVDITTQAQDPAIDRPLLALPAQMRATATVIKWKSDFTYDTLRKGTSRLVCYERPVLPEQPPFSMECTSVANLERVAQTLKTEASAAPDQASQRAAFEALEKVGKWPKPEYGSLFYNLTGADQATARSHATICMPGATEKTLGLPENGNQGGAWIMYAGSSAAHIMVPGH